MAPTRPSLFDYPPPAEDDDSPTSGESSAEQSASDSSSSDDSSPAKSAAPADRPKTAISQPAATPTKRPAESEPSEAPKEKTSDESSDADSGFDSSSDDDSSPVKPVASEEPAAPADGSKTAISKAVAPPTESEPSEAPKRSKKKSSDDNNHGAATPIKRPAETESESEPSTAAKKKKKISGDDNSGAATPTKRPPETESEPSTAAKRIKKKISNDDNPGTASKSSRRVWSDDDENAILQGIVDYTAKKGSFAASDMGALHDSIAESLEFDCTKLQLSEKVRSLKTKYLKLKGKNSEPSKPAEKKAFELSKTIWSGSHAAKEPKLNGTAVKKTASKPVTEKSKAVAETPKAVTETEMFRMDQAFQLCPMRMPDSVVQRGLDLVPGEKKSEIEGKWKEIHMAELELYVKRSELMSEQGKLILEALESWNV